MEKQELLHSMCLGGGNGIGFRTRYNVLEVILRDFKISLKGDCVNCRKQHRKFKDLRSKKLAFYLH